MTAYTDAASIAAYLAVTLTTEQATQADVVAAAVTDWIDATTGQSWQAASPVTNEIHTVTGDTVYLTQRPVTAITLVETRSSGVNAPYSVLDPSQYELLDPAHGVLSISGWGSYMARVAYTHAATEPPEALAFAATVVAADLMTTTLNPESAGAESVSVGQNDITVHYAGASGQQSSAVKAALRIISAYGRVVLA